MKKSAFREFLSGLIDNNPTLVQLLGMCSTMAVSTSAANALGMGLAATAVLICSNVVISLLRRLIPPRVRIAAYVVIIAGFVTIVDLLLQAFFPALSDKLGIYIPLIVVNCIILARAESFASKNAPGPSALDGLSMGLGFALALCVLGGIRELLGSGTLFGARVLGAVYPGAAFFLLPPGGFLVLGFVIAAVSALKNRHKTAKKSEKTGGDAS
ncbi:MAG: electron transport complex subunit E [Eubacteriales bacterium]|nr:electron transport complex subunit E [Clostridiales bacterium]MDY3285550.1 electron transport complex subunit E [Eubacteriales bacterium]MDY5014895.1 electron transport complex subunit E [Eubacteriales bacterium]